MRNVNWLLFIVCLLVLGCVGKTTQRDVIFEDQIIGLNPDSKDIPLTNMPGHEPPEYPLECICPSWFGLKRNPCLTKCPVTFSSSESPFLAFAFGGTT